MQEFDRLPYFYCLCRFVEGRAQYDANKKETGRFFCLFSFEGGKLEVMVEKSEFDKMKEGSLYNIQAVLDTVNYSQRYGGQEFQRQAFRVVRVIEITPMQDMISE